MKGQLKVSKETVSEVDRFCTENGISRKTRLQELGISEGAYHYTKSLLKDEVLTCGSFIQLSSGSSPHPHQSQSRSRKEKPQTKEMTIEIRTSSGTERIISFSMNNRLLFLGGIALSLISCGKAFYPKSDDAYRIVTYNVGAFSKYLDNSTGMVADMMKEAGADLIGINELDSVNARHDAFQLEEFASALGGWDYHFGRAMSYAGGAYGNGVVSKSGILNKFVVTLDRSGGAEQRSFVVIETDRCILGTAHLDFTCEEARLAQVKIINDWVKSHYEGSVKPVLLVGDMNAEPGSGTISSLERDWDILSETDCTYDSSNPDICIDYIFHYRNSAPVKVLGSAVMSQFKSGDVTKTSDHLPVYADLQFPAGSAGCI